MVNLRQRDTGWRQLKPGCGKHGDLGDTQSAQTNEQSCSGKFAYLMLSAARVFRLGAACTRLARNLTLR